VLGLGTRFAAGVLFVFNIVAVISYPDLGEVGLRDHQYWGLLLLIPLLHGPGKISIDHFVRRRFWN
jgi:putative oxidoreductase